jgi:hypothetical protein
MCAGRLLVKIYVHRQVPRSDVCRRQAPVYDFQSVFESSIQNATTSHSGLLFNNSFSLRLLNYDFNHTRNTEWCNAAQHMHLEGGLCVL